MLVSLVAFALGWLCALGIWRGLSPVFSHAVLQRTNLHGRPVATAGGLVVVLALILPDALVSIYRWWTTAVTTPDRPGGWGWLPDEALIAWRPFLVLALGFGLLGFIDDLLGDGDRRGFRGHVGALARGRLTTGAVKLLGGGALALGLAATVGTESWWQLVVDAALIALAANLANLFDRAPGRVTKLAVPVGIGMVLVAPATMDAELSGVPVPMAFVVGAVVGVLLPEMRERVMLGDTGANVVGAALGLGAVMGFSGGTRVVILIVLVALNVASERVSFSRVIATTPGLRELDQWGRVRE